MEGRRNPFEGVSDFSSELNRMRDLGRHGYEHAHEDHERTLDLSLSESVYRSIYYTGRYSSCVDKKMTPAADRVLAAASRLFYEQGIHAVGMEAIAEAAQVTKKTIYDRFGSKDALIEAYLRARSERWRVWLLAGVERAGPDPVERLLATFDALGSWLAQEERRGCGFLNARAELVAPDHPGRVLAEEEKAWLLELLSELVRDAGRGSPKLARQLFMLHEGAVVAYTAAADDRATATARDAAAALIRGA